MALLCLRPSLEQHWCWTLHKMWTREMCLLPNRKSPNTGRYIRHKVEVLFISNYRRIDPVFRYSAANVQYSLCNGGRLALG
ncbi:hypothetical protein PSPO01_12475 [Paraphaeosphaeria sporulosa]